MLTQRKKILTSNRGFTLIELMLAMFISGVILMVTYNIFQVQQSHYATQLDVTIMQQNIRGAMAHMSRDIRMAGFGDPGMEVGKVIAAEPNLLYFTADLNEDGDVDEPGEHIAYDLFMDGTIPTLGRTTNNAGGSISINNVGPSNWVVTAPAANRVPTAEYIENMHFQYLDQNGNQTFAEDMVRSVVISLVARAEKPDPKFNNVKTYTSYDGSTPWPKNDNFRRRVQYMSLNLRNAGI